MSFVIGLTGPTGAGKSSVTTVAEDLGFKVVDCDKFARIAVEKGSNGFADVVAVFGNEILNSDGTLNRAALAECAFATPDKTELLNKTLFESGADSLCNEIIVVLSDEKVRKKRIMERDGIDEAAAELRIRAGKPDEFYTEKTNNIVYNDCELSVLNLKIQKLLNKLLEEYENV